MILQLKLVSAWYGERLGTREPPFTTLSFSLSGSQGFACVTQDTRIATLTSFPQSGQPASFHPTFSTVNESRLIFSRCFFLPHAHTGHHYLARKRSMLLFLSSPSTLTNSAGVPRERSLTRCCANFLSAKEEPFEKSCHGRWRIVSTLLQCSPRRIIPRR